MVELKNNNYHSIAFPLISLCIFGGNLENTVVISTKYCINAYEFFVNKYFDYDIDVKLCAFTDDEYKIAIRQKEEIEKGYKR